MTAPRDPLSRLRAGLEHPEALRKPWHEGIGPAYINLFMLIAFFDRLAPRTLAVGGLGPSLLGVVVAGGLGFVLLYLAPALWGFRARAPLAVVASSTFGASGARWLPNLVMGLAQVLWFAVTIQYATDVSFRALGAVGMLGPERLATIPLWGGLRLQEPLFLAVSLTWALAAALVGTLAVRMASAVMSFYPAFPAVALGGLMLWSLGGVRDFRPEGVDPLTGLPVPDAGRYAFLWTVQLVFGFSATAGVLAADWGSTGRDARDVRLGGLLGMCLAPIIVATLALLTVAGLHGRSSAPISGPAPISARANADVGPTSSAIVEPSPNENLPGGSRYAYRVAVQQRFDGPLACASLMIFALGLLGPACYTPAVFSRCFRAIVPGLPRWGWALTGALAAWPLVATGLAGRLEPVFTLLGAALAPVIGALTSDFVIRRGRWPGPRRGLNPAGFAAWSVGFGVGVVPLIGSLLGMPALSRVQPAAVLAFAAAFLVHGLLAALRLEPPLLDASGEAPPVPVPATADSTTASPADRRPGP